MALASISLSSTITSLATLDRPTNSNPAAGTSPVPLRVLSFPAARDRVWKSGKELGLSSADAKLRWRVGVSFFPAIFKGKSREVIKGELLDAIAPLDRGADATIGDQERIDQLAKELEAVNPTKEPLKSDLVNGKWELIYTTSKSILKNKRPKFLRPNGKIYQSINVDTLRAQNMETWPYFNQVTANLEPLSKSLVKVQFDTFKIGGLIPIRAPGTARGELEITYLDEDLRVSRGYKGNLFILKMADRSYRVPL